YGFKQIYIAVNYQAEKIESHFGDGSRFDISIQYLKEKTKLGTAGALSLLPKLPKSPLLVMNGDVVTKVNLERLMDFHLQHRSVMTVAATQYHIEIPYGVLNVAGPFVMDLA